MLDGERRHGALLIATDVILIVLILLNVAAVVLETLPGWQVRYGDWFASLEIVSVIVFTIEYVLRIWSCVEDRRHGYRHPVFGRLRYALTPLAVIDLLAVLPFYLAFLVPMDLRLLRVFRLIRVLKVTRYSAALRSLVSISTRMMAVLPKRFEKYGLSLHPDKTRVIRFSRPTSSQKQLRPDDPTAPALAMALLPPPPPPKQPAK